MEYYEGGDLSSVRRPIPEPKLKKWFYQICSAVAHLHAHGIIHRDIKPKNVFLTGVDGDAILGDFGIAKYNETGAQTMWGTPFYMAPEVVESYYSHQNYNEKVDIWSLGILAYQLMIEEELEFKYRPLCPDGVFSFSLKSHEDKRNIFYNDIRTLATRGYSRELIDLVLSLLSMDPSQRPVAERILHCSLFRNFILPEMTRSPKEKHRSAENLSSSNASVSDESPDLAEHLKLMVRFIIPTKGKRSDTKGTTLKNPYFLRLGILQSDQTTKTLYETERCRHSEEQGHFTWNEFIIENWNSQISQDATITFEVYKEKKQHSLNLRFSPTTKPFLIGRAQCKKEGLKPENNLVVNDNDNNMVGLITILNAETFVSDLSGRGIAIKPQIKSSNIKTPPQLPKGLSNLSLSPKQSPKPRSSSISDFSRRQDNNVNSDNNASHPLPPPSNSPQLSKSSAQLHWTTPHSSENPQQHPLHVAAAQISRPSFEHSPNQSPTLVHPNMPKKINTFDPQSPLNNSSHLSSNTTGGIHSASLESDKCLSEKMHMSLSRSTPRGFSFSYQKDEPQSPSSSPLNLNYNVNKAAQDTTSTQRTHSAPSFVPSPHSPPNIVLTPIQNESKLQNLSDLPMHSSTSQQTGLYNLPQVSPYYNSSSSYAGIQQGAFVTYLEPPGLNQAYSYPQIQQPQVFYPYNPSSNQYPFAPYSVNYDGVAQQIYPTPNQQYTTTQTFETSSNMILVRSPMPSTPQTFHQTPPQPSK